VRASSSLIEPSELLAEKGEEETFLNFWLSSLSGSKLLAEHASLNAHILARVLR